MRVRLEHVYTCPFFSEPREGTEKDRKLLGSKVCVCEEKRVWTWEWGVVFPLGLSLKKKSFFV